MSQETVLVVDDEELLAELLQVFLEGRGYRVLTALDAEEALECFRASPEKIAVVLSDCTLPQGSGESVLRGVREMDPEVRVILVSGAASGHEQARLLAAGASRFLLKPFTPVDVEKAIRAVIDSI